MSNSSLICYTKLSPNCNKPRNQKISHIVVHHMAGNASIETCGNIFVNPSRQASSNYGIGSDGRIAMYVEECNRSWCSSSGAIDHKAITIEVANDGGDPDWHVSDKAFESLVALCTDICKRNGIASLNYTGDKSGNLHMHKWYAATGCPGPYLGSKFPELAERVNKNLSASPTPAPTPTPSTGFLPSKGYFGVGDNHENVRKIAAFMYKVFPAYTDSRCISNIFNNYLQSSIKEFQKRTNLEADGYVGPLTLAKLKEFGFSETDSVVQTLEKKEICPYAEPDYVMTKALYQNRVMEGVKWLQWHLTKLGLYSDKIDGYYGPITASSVERFQSTHNDVYGRTLDVDGMCGPLTRASIKSAYEGSSTTTSTSTSTSFKNGDKVRLISGAKYSSGESIPNWVINTNPLYVRSNPDSNGVVVISIIASGAVTGKVNTKYLTKI